MCSSLEHYIIAEKGLLFNSGNWIAEAIFAIVYSIA